MSDGRKNWHAALDDCEKRGGSLANILDNAENEEIKSFIQGA